MQANTVEQAKDKWHCPLSGKKFRAKEFVRKHILNKHGNKLEAVKMEVSLFVCVAKQSCAVKTRI